MEFGTNLTWTRVFGKSVTLKYSVNYDLLCPEENTFYPCITFKILLYTPFCQFFSIFASLDQKIQHQSFFFFLNINFERIYNKYFMFKANNIVYHQYWLLRSWHFERMFTPHNVSYVMCHVSSILLSIKKKIIIT